MQWMFVYILATVATFASFFLSFFLVGDSGSKFMAESRISDRLLTVMPMPI